MSAAATLGGLDRTAFVSRLGGIYEHSPWVAERAFAAGPFDSVDALHAAMQAAVLAAAPAEQMALIRAHPELGARLEAATVTDHSRAEQRGAGLDRCTAEEKSHMQVLNQRYREKFGFPFIVAVKGLDWAAIITRMEARLAHTREQEVATALAEIGRIARFRLEALA